MKIENGADTTLYWSSAVTIVLSSTVSSWILTRTPETLNHHPRAAVHWNAAIFELIRGFQHILLPENIMMISQTVQELTNTNTQTNTDRHYWKRFRFRCAGVDNKHTIASVCCTWVTVSPSCLRRWRQTSQWLGC